MGVPPIIFTGNPLIIKPGMVFFMHMILTGSFAQKCTRKNVHTICALAYKKNLLEKNFIDKYQFLVRLERLELS